MYTHTHIQAPVRDLVDVGVNVGVCLPVWRSLDATLVLPRACTLHPQYVPVSPSLTHSLSLFLSLSLSRARALSIYIVTLGHLMKRTSTMQIINHKLFRGRVLRGVRGVRKMEEGRGGDQEGMSFFFGISGGAESTPDIVLKRTSSCHAEI